MERILISQCYDGASVISGDKSEVQKKIRDIVGTRCFYVHCYAHRLNLVVVITGHGVEQADDFWLDGGNVQIFLLFLHFIMTNLCWHRRIW